MAKEQEGECNAAAFEIGISKGKLNPEGKKHDTGNRGGDWDGIFLELNHVWVPGGKAMELRFPGRYFQFGRPGGIQFPELGWKGDVNEGFYGFVQ